MALWRGLSDLAAAIRTVTTLVASTVAVGVSAWALRDKEFLGVPGWLAAIAVGVFLVATVSAFLLGRKSYRRLAPTAAERAREELEIARNYIRHITDFMIGLRVATTSGPETGVQRLEALRDLVFDAIIQGINTAAGEHIRCALFEPIEEGDETLLRAVRHRGHTHTVENLRLRMTSVAGRAFTNGAPEYVGDAETSPLVQQTPAGRPVRTLLCVPVYFYEPEGHTRPRRVLSVASNMPDAFSPSDQAFVSTCADIIALVELFIELFTEGEDEIPTQAPRAGIEPGPAELGPPGAGGATPSPDGG
jgi:multisubunit Na+/H+ antiporter MnhG subunit